MRSTPFGAGRMQWVTLRGNDRLGNFLTAAPSPLSFLSSATRDGNWFLSRKCSRVVTLRCLSHVECSSPQSERSCSHPPDAHPSPCRFQSMSLGFFDQLLAELSDENHPCTVGKLHSEKRNRKLPIFIFLDPDHNQTCAAAARLTSSFTQRLVHCMTTSTRRHQ